MIQKMNNRLRKGSKSSSIASIHEKIQESLIDMKIEDLTRKLYQEEYNLYKNQQVNWFCVIWHCLI